MRGKVCVHRLASMQRIEEGCVADLELEALAGGSFGGRDYSCLQINRPDGAAGRLGFCAGAALRGGSHTAADDCATWRLVVNRDLMCSKICGHWLARLQRL